VAAWAQECKDQSRLVHGQEIFIKSQSGLWRAARVLINKPHKGKLVVRFKNGKTLNYFLRGEVKVAAEPHQGVLLMNSEMVKEFGNFPEEKK